MAPVICWSFSSAMLRYSLARPRPCPRVAWALRPQNIPPRSDDATCRSDSGARSAPQHRPGRRARNSSAPRRRTDHFKRYPCFQATSRSSDRNSVKQADRERLVAPAAFEQPASSFADPAAAPSVPFRAQQPERLAATPPPGPPPGNRARRQLAVSASAIEATKLGGFVCLATTQTVFGELFIGFAVAP